jgi:hypothetical protein
MVPVVTVKDREEYISLGVKNVEHASVHGPSALMTYLESSSKPADFAAPEKTREELLSMKSKSSRSMPRKLPPPLNSRDELLTLIVVGTSTMPSNWTEQSHIWMAVTGKNAVGSCHKTDMDAMQDLKLPRTIAWIAAPATTSTWDDPSKTTAEVSKKFALTTPSNDRIALSMNENLPPTERDVFARILFWEPETTASPKTKAPGPATTPPRKRQLCALKLDTETSDPPFMVRLETLAETNDPKSKRDDGPIRTLTSAI